MYASPVLPQGAVDRDAYVVCVLEQLHRALNNRDVFASPSHRWSNPRARLLEGPEWDAVCEDVLAALSLDMPGEEHLAELVRGLDAGWKQLAERLEEAGPAAKVSIEVQDDGRVKLHVDKLGALGEPKSLTWLRGRVEKMLPKIDLPDLLFEVNAWTGFLDAFVHLGDGTTRMKDLPTSVVALLVSEACNIGLAPVVNPGYEALTRARLVHVDQYYLRADTIAAANARLIEAQAAVPIVRFWGKGLLASVDGLRFVVPVRTVSAAPSPKYFGFKRGITWLNAVNDQVAGIGQMVVPGTPRDSLHILDALLNLDGGIKPEMVATDNASYLVTWTPCPSLRVGGGRPCRQARWLWGCPCAYSSGGKRTARPWSNWSTKTVCRSRSLPGSCASSAPGTAHRTRSSRTPTTFGTCGASSRART